MASVGLIVNPSAARDVRRLTSLARTIDVHERVNVVARILAGLLAGGVTELWFMPVAERVVERARDALAAMPDGDVARALRARQVALPGDGLAHDASGTAAAAAAMAKAGVGCIVSVGGDGTHRAAVAGWPDLVIVPLAGGTNNAFATAIDPMAAGLAAALYVQAPDRYRHNAPRRPRLVVSVDGTAARVALVDVAIVDGGWIGARAVWEPGRLVEAVVTRSDPALTGLAGAAGAVWPLDGGEPRAIRLRFGQSSRLVLAPLGPGRLGPLEVRGWDVLDPDERISLPSADDPGRGAVTLALDGERDFVLAPGSTAIVRFALDGPYVLDAAGLLRSAALAGRLVPRPGPDAGEAAP